MAKRQNVSEGKLGLQQIVDKAMQNIKNPRLEAPKFLKKGKRYEMAGERDKADASYLLFVRCARDCKSRMFLEGANTAIEMSDAAVNRGDEETADVYFTEIVKTLEAAGNYDMAIKFARAYEKRNNEIVQIANSRANAYRQMARQIRKLKRADEKVITELNALNNLPK